MKEELSYDALKAKGVGNYIQTLKNLNLFESVAQRLKKKNGMETIPLIEQLFAASDLNFCNYLFSDFNFGSSFFEDFASNVARGLQTGFNRDLGRFEISYVFYHRVSKDYLGETKFPAGRGDHLSKEEIQHFNDWMRASDPIYKIQAEVKEEIFDFTWSGFDHCAGFLKEMNRINKLVGNPGAWHPLLSDYYEHYIFTTKEIYDLIRNQGLIMPENYKSEKLEYPIPYATRL